MIFIMFRALRDLEPGAQGPGALGPSRFNDALAKFYQGHPPPPKKKKNKEFVMYYYWGTLQNMLWTPENSHVEGSGPSRKIVNR